MYRYVNIYGYISCIYNIYTWYVIWYVDNMIIKARICGVSSLYLGMPASISKLLLNLEGSFIIIL